MACRSTTRGFWLPHIHHMFHLTIELKDLQRRCPCGVNRAISKNSTLDMRAARRLPPRLRTKDVSSHRPLGHRWLRALPSSRTTRWWYQSTPVSKRVRDAHTRRKCSAHAPGTIVGRRGHHHDVRNGLGAAEMPRRVEHTQPVTRRTFPPRAQPLTHARTPALRQHPRTTQWDRVTRGRAGS